MFNPRSKKARLIRQLIKLEENDGAEGVSAYRDVVTDLLHVFHRDTRIPEKEKIALNSSLSFDTFFVGRSFDEFLTELEDEENKQMWKIPKKKLPLYLNFSWKFESTREQFTERMKKEIGG